MLINQTKNIKHYILGLIISLLLLFPSLTYGQLNEHCMVSILNRTSQVKPNGSWVIPNVPTNIGKVMARATCVENGVTRSGQSDWLVIPANGSVFAEDIQIGLVDQVPRLISIQSPIANLGSIGITAQLTGIATYPNNRMLTCI